MIAAGVFGARWGPRLLLGASGFASLGYEIVWTEQSALWLGHEAAAVLAVVTAFFGGLALGALTFSSRIESSRRPRLWYVGCELAAGLWSLVLLGVALPMSAWAQQLSGLVPSALWQWSVAFLGTFLMFLPATAAMGATLPAMERLTTSSVESRSSAASSTERRLSAAPFTERRSIAALYASNTFGAVLGALAVAFWLIPTLGLNRSAAVCMVINLLGAGAAWFMFPKTTDKAAPLPPFERARAYRVLWRLALTGFLGIGYEVLVVRVLSQVTEDTVYTFALLLAVYLAGSAAGAAAYRRWLETRPLEELGNRLAAALAVACLLCTAGLWAAELLKHWALDVFGRSLGAALAAEALLACVAFGPPTLLMGALFSQLSRAASAAGVGFGRALGSNMLAAAAAPALLGVLAVPILGPKGTSLLIVFGYLALTERRVWFTPLVGVPALAALGVALLAPALRFVDVPSGGKVLSYREGVMAAVSVVEDANGVVSLRINNRQQEGSNATFFVDARQAWLPLLLQAAPQSALFLGLGTGVTATAAALDSTLYVDAVELLPEVIAASPHFTSSSGDGRAAQRLHVFAADARSYVRVTERRYDVIVSDNFHPARSGSGSLYTVEHFAAVRARLTPGGVFCQWLPLHQLDLQTLRSIVRSFTTVYVRSWALLANNSLQTPLLGLVARADGNRFDVAALRRRLAQRAASAELRASQALGLEDELAVLGSFVAGPQALEQFAGNAPANTDDRPVVAYSAPRITYAPDSSPKRRLSMLLAQLSIHPDELIQGEPDAGWSRHLAAYWAARAQFIEFGQEVRPAAGVEEMLAQVQEPLLSVLRISPDFRPAYDPLLGMARALVQLDSVRARGLLGELDRIQPARVEAAELLRRMRDIETSR